jgi:hypothetical protein
MSVLSRWMRAGVCRTTLAVAAVTAALTLPVTAAVVLPASFEELVAEAQNILIVETVATRSSMRSGPDGRFIETAVTFKVDGVVKGAFVRQATLRFLGGTVGDLTMQVSDMVQFTKGDRDVLFVADANNPLNALVGFNQGRFRIGRGDVVLTHEGQPLGIQSQRGSPSLFASPMSQGVSLNTFIAHIRTTANAAGVNLR